MDSVSKQTGVPTVVVSDKKAFASAASCYFTEINRHHKLATMRSAVLCLAVSFALFGFGLSLTCYNCPEGLNGTCLIQQQCSLLENSCLKLTSKEITYTSCIRHSDCDFRTLSVRFPVAQFSFSCCQSELCNETKKKKGALRRFLDMFG